MSHKMQTIGSPFIVLCNIDDGSHPVFFEWFKNSKPIKSGPDVNYKIENTEIFSTFTIKRVVTNDGGNYTCTAKNPFGSDSQTVALNVKGMILTEYEEFWSG